GEPRVSGRVDALASVSGWFRDLTLEATATGDDILLGPVSAERMRASLNAGGIFSGSSRFSLTATADTALAFSHPFQVARLELAGAGDSVAVTTGASTNGEDVMFARGALHRFASDSGLSVLGHLDELRLGRRS